MGRSPTEISLRSDLAASRQIMVCGSKVRKETPASASQEERRSKQRVNNESFVSSPAVAIIFERSGRKKYRNGNYGRSGRCRSHSISRKKRGSRELCARPFPPPHRMNSGNSLPIQFSAVCTSTVMPHLRIRSQICKATGDLYPATRLSNLNFRRAQVMIQKHKRSFHPLRNLGRRPVAGDHPSGFAYFDARPQKKRGWSWVYVHPCTPNPSSTTCLKFWGSAATASLLLRKDFSSPFTSRIHAIMCLSGTVY